MLRTLLFASHNQKKVAEVLELLPPGYDLKGLHELNLLEDIPEPYDTFEDNAIAKTSFVFNRTGIPCFADDSGLEVDALDGRPGILSARFAGEHRSSADNLNKVLKDLGDEQHRSARFVAVIAYQPHANDIHLFRGEVQGIICYQPAGTGGFGYDPIFIPEGFDQTFAQLSPDIKNRISHRSLAMKQFLSFLRNS